MLQVPAPTELPGFNISLTCSQKGEPRRLPTNHNIRKRCELRRVASMAGLGTVENRGTVRFFKLEKAHLQRWIGQEDLIGFLSSPKNRFDAAGKMLEKLGTGALYLLVIQLEGTNGNLFSVCSPLHFLTRLPSMRDCYFQEGEEVKMNMTVENAYCRSIETVVDWIDWIGVCTGIFKPDNVSADDVVKIVDTFPGQSIDFFGALRARVYDDEVRKWVSGVGVDGIGKKLVNSKEGPPTFEQPKMTVEKLLHYGQMLVQEQDNVKRFQLADKYLSDAALGDANQDSIKRGEFYGSKAAQQINVPVPEGCTDPSAANFDPTARSE
ncbi:ribulose bisphosphate carboxylase/oxygenase activase chloroplastic [Prunus yedoensis var. nudiflora]|uniref:Ribulose bisphosphate carboxylase/oxygenase activase chloroplastic n=1 Tax=Prunus yedoensis var. nudiflora TaxID=2094558 RepID=A0A314YYS6_PRUYE|nr:ribulose bisphosphate carboxylase/oxygenase activase chloroplastic [Prunus yedoensis var. nudiflora]